jgi:hypothetical protein
LRRRLAAVVLTVAAVAGACSDPQRATPEVPPIFDLNDDPAAAIAPVSADRVNVLAAKHLRLTLEKLFGWHVVTLTEVMDRTERGDKDLPQWMDALAANTDDIVAAVGLVYGPTGGRAFAQLWANHTQFLIDYSAATANADRGERQAALDHLADYEHDSAALIDRATGGRAAVAPVEQQLSAHVSQMTNALDAAADGKAESHAQISADAHAYAMDIGDGLAGAIAAQQPVAFPGAIDDPATVRCSLVNRTLGSWTLLAGGAADGMIPRKVAEPLRHSLLTSLDGRSDRVGWATLESSGFEANVFAASDADPLAVTAAARYVSSTLAALGDRATAEQVKALYDATNALAAALYP